MKRLYSIDAKEVNLMKKWTTVLGVSILAVGLLAPTVNASPLTQQAERVPILVAINETDVSKEQLIKKLKQVLPAVFRTYTNNDFQMSMMSYHYQDDETTRYELMFNKTVNKQMVSGSVTFVGEQLEIEGYYYYPTNTKDALFPGKISSNEAQKIARQFVKKVINSDEFMLMNDMPSYQMNRVITEPITYSYSFVRTENNIPIQDQTLHVSILADGTIQYFNQMMPSQKRLAFEDQQNMLSKQAAEKIFKDQIELELQYKVDYSPTSGKPTVQLVYEPTAAIVGLHATTNKWVTYSEIVDTMPTKTKLQPISSAPLQSIGPITLEQAKQYAKQLVEKDSNNTKFTIDSAYEQEMNGEEMMSIIYSYHFGNHTHSSSIEFNKKTGELISYADFYDNLPLAEQENNSLAKLEKQKVVQLAEQFVKQLAPTVVQDYSKPIVEPIYDAESGVHYVTFPKIKNGLIVNGDNLSLSIGDDGKLKSYYRSTLPIEEWPNPKDAIELSKASATFKEAIGAKLIYSQVGNNNDYYKLVYIPVVNDKEYYQIDALTGKIVNSLYGESNPVTITHPTAEKELNYLIQAGAIDVKNPTEFNADVPISKGQALNTLVKSITYFYEDYYSYPVQSPPASFDNIDQQHPYYSIVERATQMGILKPGKESFNPDEQITREELAVWYIRTLGLEQAAKQSDIFQLTFTDKKDITPSRVGYVALSQALGIQQLEKSKFNPTKVVSYAELAPSIIELAYVIAEKQRSESYY